MTNLQKILFRDQPYYVKIYQSGYDHINNAIYVYVKTKFWFWTQYKLVAQSTDLTKKEALSDDVLIATLALAHKAANPEQVTRCIECSPAIKALYQTSNES